MIQNKTVGFISVSHDAFNSVGNLRLHRISHIGILIEFYKFDCVVRNGGGKLWSWLWTTWSENQRYDWMISHKGILRPVKRHNTWKEMVIA